jgi:DNA (cytosine-5)-methyltransferase 1
MSIDFGDQMQENHQVEVTAWRVLDLFSGIGGFSLGLERAGMETVAFCEIEEYPRKVLAKHWPDVPIYSDVRELTSERLRADGIIGIDVITAGFPCQDISTAGKGAGIEGERSGLWSEIARLSGELRPRYIILENVSALLSRGLDKVLGDMAEIGYDAEWHCIPASHLGAPHRRDRWWCVAYPGHDEKVSREPEGEDRPANVPSIRGGNGRSVQRHCEVSGDRAEKKAILSEDVADTKSEQCNVSDNHTGVSMGREQVSESGNRSWSNDGEGQDIGRDEDVAYPSRERQSGSGKLVKSERTAQTANREAGWTWAVGELRIGEPQPNMGILAHGISAGLARSRWLPEPGVGRVTTGIPDRTARLKALGNSLIPQIPEIIGLAIMGIDEHKD